MLKFDITQEPPTQQEIEQERERLQEAQRYLNRKYCAWTAAGIVLYIALLITWVTWGVSYMEARQPNMSPPSAIFADIDGSAIAFSIAIVFAVVFSVAFASKLRGKLSALRGKIRALSPNPEYRDLPVKIVEICRNESVCDEYRLAVARQRRDLVKAETEAIENWPGTKAQRDEEREIEDARRLLKSEARLSKEY